MSRVTRFRRIVVAVDFSDDSAIALGRLGSLPLAAAPRLHLVHIVAVPTLTPLPVAREIAGKEMAKLVRLVQRRVPRARVTVEIGSGRPADEIVRIAGEQAAEVIVAGRRGAGGFPRLMLGSTAERLARRSPVPLLLVGAASTVHRQVLMPLDVTEDVSAIIHATLRLLPARRRVELLHAYWAYGQGYMRLGGASERAVARHRAMVREQASERMAPIVRALTAADMRVSTSLLNGDPRRLVPRVMRATKPDLIAIGNHARNAISRALIGSVASEVLKIARCDLLLVPVA